MESTDVYVSSLIDTWLLLRDIELVRKHEAMEAQTAVLQSEYEAEVPEWFKVIGNEKQEIKGSNTPREEWLRTEKLMFIKGKQVQTRTHNYEKDLALKIGREITKTSKSRSPDWSAGKLGPIRLCERKGQPAGARSDRWILRPLLPCRLSKLLPLSAILN